MKLVIKKLIHKIYYKKLIKLYLNANYAVGTNKFELQIGKLYKAIQKAPKTFSKTDLIKPAMELTEMNNMSSLERATYRTFKIMGI